MAFYKIPKVGEVPPTPFYHYDMDLLKRTLLACRQEAERYGYSVHYAMKANVEPPILRAIASEGFGADCVSGWEVQAALENGFPASGVVFAGVGKSDSEMIYALEQDIFCFNCESLEEIQVLDSLAASLNRVARIALRLNPDIEPDTHKHISTGQSGSKFGISLDELQVALSNLGSYKNIEVVGIHFHIGSGILNFQNFIDLSHKVNEINDWFLSKGVSLKHLNMGGGLGIDYSDPDAAPISDFRGYFQAFADNLRVREGQKVHFELGRSIVCQCGELISRVLFTKTTASGEKFAILDAGMTELIRPALYSASHKIENLTSEGEDRPVERYYIAGPICESSDIFARDVEFPHSKRGDLIAIRSCGAYGSIMSSNYNLRPTAKAYFD